jgi:hypothetical protein
MDLIKSLIRSIVSIEHVSEVQKKERLATCTDCPKRKIKNNGDEVCTECGCFIDLKAPLKTNKNPKKLMRFEITHCPLGKWKYLDNEGVWHENDKEVANYFREIDGKPLL